MTDILVERLDIQAGADGTTISLANDVGDLSKAIVRNINASDKSSGGPVGSTANTGPHITGVGLELTATDTITFRRGSSSTTAGMLAEVWRYDGPAGGPNEFVTRAHAKVTIPQGQNSASLAISGIVNASKVVPMLNGYTTNISDTSNYEMTTVGVRMSGTNLVVSRVSTGGASDVVVYVEVVEFTGSNWVVASASDASHDTGTPKNLTLSQSIVDWDKTLIFGSMEGDSAETGLSDCLFMAYPGPSTTQVTFDLHDGDANAKNDGEAFLYAVYNPDLQVHRAYASSVIEGNNSYGTPVAWPAGAPTGANDDKLALEWWVDTSGVGTAHARGRLAAAIDNVANNIKHWVHRSGNNIVARYGVIDLTNLVGAIPTPVTVDELSQNQSLDATTIVEIPAAQADELSQSVTLEEPGLLPSEWVTAEGVSQNQSLGTIGAFGYLYWAVYPAATPDPEAMDVVQQFLPGYIYGRDSASVQSGTFTGAEISGLTEGEEYKVAAVWFDGTSLSNLVISAPFTSSSGLTIVPASMAQGSALEAASITVKYQASADDVAQTQVLAPTSVAAQYVVTTDELGQASTLETINLSAKNSVTVEPLVSATDLDGVDLTQHHVLAVGQLSSDVTLGSPDIAFKVDVSVDPLALAAYLEGTDLLQRSSITLDEVDQAHSLGAPGITQGHVITPGRLEALQALGQGALTQHHIAALDSLAQTITLGAAVAVPKYTLALASLLSDQALDQPGVSANTLALTDDLSHAVSIANVALTQHYKVAVEDLPTVMALSTVGLTQNYRVPPDEISHAHSAGGVSLVQRHKLVASILRQAQVLRQVGLTQHHEIATDSIRQAVNLEAPEITLVFPIQVAGLSQAHLLRSGNLDYLVGVDALTGTVVVYPLMSASHAAGAQMVAPLGLDAHLGAQFNAGGQVIADAALSGLFSGTIVVKE